MPSDRPRLLVVCGVPGVGKTTVSEYVADEWNATLYRTDVVRKELFPDPEYTSAESRRVYEEVLGRGRTTLAAGTDVVLDGTFRTRELRSEAAEIGTTVDAAVQFLKVECDTAVVKERIATRDGPSDAEFEEHMVLREQFQPLEREHVAVDNSGSCEETRRQLAERLAIDGLTP